MGGGEDIHLSHLYSETKMKGSDYPPLYIGGKILSNVWTLDLLMQIREIMRFIHLFVPYKISLYLSEIKDILYYTKKCLL